MVNFTAPVFVHHLERAILPPNFLQSEVHMKLWTTLSALAISLLFVSTAQAQPYSPKKMSPSELIQPATYERVPIRLKKWNVETTRSVVNGKRLDFEQTYDVDFWELVDYFEQAFEKREPVSILDPEVFPHANTPELIVYGRHGSGDYRNFTLGNPDLPYRFTLRVRPDDRSRAVVTIANAVYSAVYSGTMPARTPFKPAGKAKPIRFRWN